MNIKIKKHLLLYKDYKLKCSVGKSGIRSQKKEGDFATPKGKSALAIFRISGKGSHKIIKKISSQKKWKTNLAKVNFLLDEDNKHTNAQNITLDGGWLSW